MKEFIFDRKNYKSYKDMYEDLAMKLERINGLVDYYDIHNYDYDPHCLDEDLRYGFDRDGDNKFILINFDRETIKLHKNFDDYQYEMILEVFEDFVREYPNNKLEFRMEE